MGGGMSIEMWLAEDDNAVFSSELQRNVFDEFAWEPTLNDSDLSVSADDHVVTLSGVVKSYPQKLDAERAAKRVRGVQVVRNHLAVVLPSSDQRSDREIARAVGMVLELDVLVPRDAIRATVAGGCVWLEGEVTRDAERRAASAAVERLVGVKGVASAVTIRPAARQGDLKARLQAALHRCAGLRGDHIEVEASDGAVLLRGHVRSLAEREDAERAVWTVPGIADVRDALEVEGQPRAQRPG